jgi:peptide/nickel transport system permease protein
MARYIASRLIQAIIVVWIVATFVFFLLRLAPGDPAVLLAGLDADPTVIEQTRERFGLNDPLAEQYVRFLGEAAQGDFRDSVRTNQPALDLVIDKFPATLKLALISFVISVGLGGLIGVASAVWPGGPVDRFGKLFAVLGQSMPTFWIGLLFILLFSVELGWLPTAGDATWKHYILPAATLGWFSMAAMMRLTRSAMLDVLESDHVKMLRIKGLPERSVIMKHALRNASIPVLTLASLQLVAFLSGSVVVETIFGWPGVGRLMVDSVTARDYTVIQAATFLISVLLVLVNLVVDLSYAYIDPRIRYA